MIDRLIWPHLSLRNFVVAAAVAWQEYPSVSDIACSGEKSNMAKM